MRKFTYSSPRENLDFIREKKKKTHNWGKTIYQIIIALIFLSLFLFLGSKVLFSISKGEVSSTRFSVSLPFAVQIERIYVEEDDSVKAGDLLFTYNTAISIENTSKEAELWLLRERIQANQHVTLARILVREAEKAIAIEKEYADKILKMVKQNLKSREAYDEQLYKVELLQVELDKRREEYNYYLGEYQKVNLEYSDLLHAYHTDTARLYHAPMDGIINRVIAADKEFMNGEEIMKIINNNEIYVYAYVQLRDVNRFNVGSEVKVLFPDYHQGSAVIKHIYKEVELLPEDLRVMDGDRFALLKLSPIGLEEKERWSRLDGTTVKVITTNFKNRFKRLNLLIEKSKDRRALADSLEAIQDSVALDTISEVEAIITDSTLQTDTSKTDSVTETTDSLLEEVIH